MRTRISLVVFILALAGLSLSNLSHSLFQASAQEPSHFTEARGKGGDYSVIVFMQTRRMATFAESTQWWGAAGQRSSHVVTGMRVFRKGHELFLPRSAFADLTDIREIHVHPTQEGCRIVMLASDSSNTYNVTFWLASGIIRKRRVEFGLAGVPCWEETRYKNVPVDTPRGQFHDGFPAAQNRP